LFSRAGRRPPGRLCERDCEPRRGEVCRLAAAHWNASHTTHHRSHTHCGSVRQRVSCMTFSQITNQISRTWKVLENDVGTGKSWNLLAIDADGSLWLQIDMFLQMKIAIIVGTKYVFCTAGMPEMFFRPGLRTHLGPPPLGELSVLPNHLAAVCRYI